MSYTTVIGGKLKLKGVNIGSTGLNRNTNNHPTTSSSSSVSQKPSSSSSSFGLAPPRLPISQPYAPGEREEMSKGYLKNAFARESSSTADVEPSSEQVETEKGNANKQGGGGGGGERKGPTAESSPSSSSSTKQLAVSRKRGRSEDNTVEGERGQGASTSMMTTTNGHVKSGLPGSSDGGRDNYDALQPESRGEALPRARTDGVEVSIATSSLTSSNQHQQQLNTSGGSVRSDQQKISSSSVVTTSSSSSTKTAAQLRFEEAQAKRLHERAKKEAVKSHREKIEDLNKLLETMPEHYDLFRISYGGQG